MQTLNFFFMVCAAALVALLARSADVGAPASASTFHVRVRAPRSSTIIGDPLSNDTCYNEYARFSILKGGTVGTEGEWEALKDLHLYI